MGKYEEIGKDIGQLVEAKQKAYGDSFGCSADFLMLLYPDGIRPADYHNLLLIVRIFDKLKRIATNNDISGENPFMDIVGYGLLACGSRSQMPTPPVISKSMGWKEDEGDSLA